jgi:hypothetical protein
MVRFPLVLGLVAAMAAGAAFAHPDPGKSGPAPASVNMQGDQASWINDPHMHAFYQLSVAAFAHGPDKVDQARFEQDAQVIFRDFAVSRHIDPAMMQDHLKLIPGQVVQIAKEDPKVLQSYDAFVVALFGPQ